jgi:hypothetical protein
MSILFISSQDPVYDTEKKIFSIQTVSAKVPIIEKLDSVSNHKNISKNSIRKQDDSHLYCI